ncbi:MAG TPA: phosphotransacetylase family protein [Nitrospirota bacterium]|jgi:BioD-like phosphotransacetylase family protein|nr:phosphotransacetylase family protein [Nitrospirota bacterium]
MVPILVASNTGYAGRTFISLGLGLKLMDMGYKVGMMKPFGNAPVKAGKDVYDADAPFIRETLGLDEPLDVISPFVMSFEEQTLLFQGKSVNARQRVLAAYKSFKKKDFIILCGASDLLEGSLLGIDAVSLAEEVKAKVILVEPWRGDLSADSLFGARSILGRRYAGGVFNKVPEATMEFVKNTVKPFLETKGVAIFGVMPKDKFLESVTVGQLNEILNGTVLCREDKLDEFVENFLIGAMDVDSALNYFRRVPNKAVITGAHRADIQLAALETSTKCIILTGGFQTNEVVLGKARARGIPILSVPSDTFTAIDKIEFRMGKTSIREKQKVERAKELISAGFDMFGFLKKLNKV